MENVPDLDFEAPYKKICNDLKKSQRPWIKQSPKHNSIKP